MSDEEDVYAEEDNFSYDYQPQGNEEKMDTVNIEEEKNLPPPPDEDTPSEEEEEEVKKVEKKKKAKKPKKSKKKKKIHKKDTESEEEEEGEEVKVGCFGECGENKVGIEPFCYFKWSRLPICFVNPYYCSNIKESSHRWLLYLTNVEFWVHLIAFVYSVFGSVFYYVLVLIGQLSEEKVMEDSYITYIIAIATPVIVVVGGIIFVAILFAGKHWAIYHAGIGTWRYCNYGLYTCCSVTITLFELFLVGGFSGGIGIFSLIYSLKAIPVAQNYARFVAVVSGIGIVVWFSAMLYSILIFIILVVKCSNNIKKNRGVTEEDDSEDSDNNV